MMLVLCTVIWGGTFPAVKVALAFTTPWIIVAFRFTVAGLIFAMLYRRAAFRVAPALGARRDSRFLLFHRLHTAIYGA
jgi:drug/metabolite transporter (DMT)-like permease